MNHYTLYKKITILLNDLQEMILWFRMQNFNRGERLFTDWSGRYGQVIAELSAMKGDLNAAEDGPLLIDETVIVSELQALMRAMEQKDYVLMADLMQMQTVTFLEAVQEVLRKLPLAGPVGETLSEEELADAMFRIQGASCEMDGRTYQLEPTTSGNLTLSITDENGMYYLHSNAYPAKEGNLFALQYYDDNIPA